MRQCFPLVILYWISSWKLHKIFSVLVLITVFGDITNTSCVVCGYKTLSVPEVSLTEKSSTSKYVVGSDLFIFFNLTEASAVITD